MKEEMERLAESVALRAQRKLGKKASLRLVGRENLHREVAGAPAPSPKSLMDDITREGHYRMIRHYRHFWGPPMQILIDQACREVAGFEQLGDEELRQLMRDMDRGVHPRFHGHLQEGRSRP
ncbi:hypothetical protein KWH39_19275 [Xanthomonas campestris pv. obscurae]|nr:hypothetical protein [Xanthomonas campestris pv. obscurae]